jgi:hypothetical protein
MRAAPMLSTILKVGEKKVVVEELSRPGRNVVEIPDL